jgi:hypothetical protein
MSIPYTSEDFTTPRAGGESWVEYPFIEYGDNSSKVYHMRCTVNKDDYSAIALNTTMASASNADVLALPFAADTNAYFVGDFNHRVIDGALLEFDRQFATIPATNEDYPGTEFFTFPGLPYQQGSAAVSCSSVSYSGGIQTINAKTNHGLSPGDQFRINIFISYYQLINGSVNIITYDSIAVYDTAISGTSGTTLKSTVKIGQGNYTENTTAYSPTARIEIQLYPDAVASRSAIELSANTKIINDYFLPGVSPDINNVNDIFIEQKFQPVTASTGAFVEDLSAGTIPSANQYKASINNNDYITKDCAIQQYKGNIYVRKTKKIVAS